MSKIKSKLMCAMIGILNISPHLVIADDILQGNVGKDSYFIGKGAEASGKHSVAIGDRANAKGLFSYAVGEGSSTLKSGGIAFGHDASAKEILAVAVGMNSNAEMENSVALGSSATAKTKSSTAVGSYSLASREYDDETKKNIISEIRKSNPNEKIDLFITEVSVGGFGPYKDATVKKEISEKKYSQITHVAPGTENTDAVNLFQTNKIVKREVDKLKEEEVEVNKKMIEVLKSDTANLNDIVNQDDDGTMYIGKTLQGTLLSVSGTQGDRVITGVLDGTKSNDAVNIAQLNQVRSTATSAHGLAQKNTARINNMENQLSKTNKKIDRGLAASAALTGLFQPYGVGKVNVTAGIGGYGSSQALAIGTGYRVNENAAVKAGIADSGGNSMIYNASFNLKW